MCAAPPFLCAGDALDPPLWKIPKRALSLLGGREGGREGGWEEVSAKDT